MSPNHVKAGGSRNEKRKNLTGLEVPDVDRDCSILSVANTAPARSPWQQHLPPMPEATWTSHPAATRM